MTSVEESKTETNEEASSMKHPLENVWEFWLFANEQQADWEMNLKPLSTFATVEDYWCLYHYMKLPSELPYGQDYYIFKQGIQPKWEDPRNVRGGRWIIGLSRRSDLDRGWLDTVLLMIGESFENNNDVCGVVVNVRQGPGSKVCLWMADSSREEANKEVARKVKKQLALTSRLNFRAHNKTSNLYTV